MIVKVVLIRGDSFSLESNQLEEEPHLSPN